MAANLGQVLLQEQLLNEEQIQTVTEYKAEIGRASCRERV